LEGFFLTARVLRVSDLIFDAPLAAAPRRSNFKDSDAIADAYRHLHRQHPSAWTHELDLRPFKEPF
jgi:hypothetical protein